MLENEWFFYHPKVYLLGQDLIIHCETCKQCSLHEYVLTELSQSEYDKDSEIRSVVLLCKSVVKTMHLENAIICNDIIRMQNCVDEITDDQHDF